MNITNFKLKIIKNPDKPNLLGMVDLELDNELAIHDIRLVKTNNGKRIMSFPSKRIVKYTYKDDEEGAEIDNFEKSYQYSDLIHPLNAQFREKLENQIFKIYDEQVGGK